MGLETVLQVLYLDTNEKENLLMNLLHNGNDGGKKSSILLKFYFPPHFSLKMVN